VRIYDQCERTEISVDCVQSVSGGGRTLLIIIVVICSSRKHRMAVLRHVIWSFQCDYVLMYERRC